MGSAFFGMLCAILFLRELEGYWLATICFHITSVLHSGFPFWTTADGVDGDFREFGVGAETVAHTGFAAGKCTHFTHSAFFVHDEEDNNGT